MSTQEEDMVMERFSESVRPSEDDGGSSCKDDADEELLQLSVLVSQESEPSTQNHPTGLNPQKLRLKLELRRRLGCMH